MELITAVAMCNCFGQSVRYNYPTLALMPFKEGRVVTCDSCTKVFLAQQFLFTCMNRV